MGLDMYLTLNNEFVDGDPLAPIQSSGADEGGEELIYWRKANAIHNWFVDNVQDGYDDCRTYLVSREQLERLKDICERVSQFHMVAAGLLPPKEGFFFGTTQYDDYYFHEVERTARELERILLDLRPDDRVYYHSSW